MNMQWKEHGSAIRINIFSVSNFLSTDNFKKKYEYAMKGTWQCD